MPTDRQTDRQRERNEDRNRDFLAWLKQDMISMILLLTEKRADGELICVVVIRARGNQGGEKT